MQLLEHAAKRLFADAGVVVPDGDAAPSPADAGRSAQRLLAEPSTDAVMVKALLPVGGRGKLGLVRRCETAPQVVQEADSMLGQRIQGHRVEAVLVEQAVSIQQELYAAVAYDAVARSPLAILGADGGVDVEHGDGAAGLLRIALDPRRTDHHDILGGAWSRLGFSGPLHEDLTRVTNRLAQLHCETDAELVEVNPLCLTAAGGLVAADAVIRIDPAGMFRQDFVAEGGERALTPLEQQVADADAQFPGMGNVQFNQFDGDIGFAMLGGGASLMTLDALQRCGARPANYSDISPGPGFEVKLRALLEAVLRQPGIRGLIYGWNILSFARGLVAGSEVLAETLARLEIDPAGFPIVARIAGVGEEEAVRTLQAYSPHITVLGRESSLDDAARAIARAVEQQV